MNSAVSYQARRLPVRAATAWSLCVLSCVLLAACGSGTPKRTERSEAGVLARLDAAAPERDAEEEDELDAEPEEEEPEEEEPEEEEPEDDAEPEGEPEAELDAEPEGEPDAAQHSEPDAAADASTSDMDAGPDSGPRDAGTDAAREAGLDATVDAARSDSGPGVAEAGPDARADAAEAGPDAAPDKPSYNPTPAVDWSFYGRDLAHTRFAANETRISKTSVARLRRAWMTPAPGISATPTIVSGVVYWSDWRGNVYARRAADGSVVWTKQRPAGFTSSPCLVGERLILADRLNRVTALDRRSGSPFWTTVVDPSPRTHLWSSPIVAEDVVVVGVASDGTQSDREPLPPEVIAQSRGSVVGLSLSTGALLWRFETTRVVGEPPDRYGPGVSVWSSAAVDVARGLIFIGTGNGYAAPVSPYSDSLLAIRYRTGELAWHVQFTPDDAFSSGDPSAGPDYDIGAAPNLFSVRTASGGTRDVVGVGDKAARYRVFDRATGALVWERQLEPGSRLPSRKTGGVIAPAAVANGRIYVASNISWGASQVWALDAQTGAVVWESDAINSVNFGAPAVANGVVFFGGSGFRLDVDPPDSIGVGEPGDLIAFDADTGDVLYRSKLYAGRGAGFAVSDGRLFIGTGFTFYGYSDEPLDGAFEVYDVP